MLPAGVALVDPAFERSLSSCPACSRVRPRGRGRPSSAACCARTGAGRRGSPRSRGRVRASDRRRRSRGRRGIVGCAAQRATAADVQPRGFDELAVAVVLGLCGRAVADADRGRVTMAAQVVELISGRSGSPSMPYMICSRSGCPPAVRSSHVLKRRLQRGSRGAQRDQRDRGVADPGVAVVPVATAADRFWQRRRRARPPRRRSARR